MLQTHYMREERVGEIFSPETMTEQVGYLSAEKQVTRLIQAGVRLDDFRKEQYHFESEEQVTEGFFDPDLEPGYDLVDAKNDFDAAMERISNAEKARKSEKAKRAEAVNAVPAANSEEKSEG